MYTTSCATIIQGPVYTNEDPVLGTKVKLISNQMNVGHVDMSVRVKADKKLLFCNFYFLDLCERSRGIRALSAHSAAEFNISPGRWQHVWLVAIVPPKRWGKMDRNDCHTAWGNFKTLISSLHHYKNYACFFSLFVFFKKKWCYF
jgi:hypothetical protein